MQAHAGHGRRRVARSLRVDAARTRSSATFGARASLQVFAQATGRRRTTRPAEDHARISMRARRHLGPGAADTFDIITPEASRSFVDAITERIGAAGPPISLMALLAAIVVVTNTTLVSVTQRTREIGVRRARRRARARTSSSRRWRSRALVALVGGAVGLLAAAGAAVAGGRRRSASPLSLEWPTRSRAASAPPA